jgi:hypothetical protein
MLVDKFDITVSHHCHITGSGNGLYWSDWRENWQGLTTRWTSLQQSGCHMYEPLFAVACALTQWNSPSFFGHGYFGYLVYMWYYWRWMAFYLIVKFVFSIDGSGYNELSLFLNSHYFHIYMYNYILVIASVDFKAITNHCWSRFYY